LPWANFGPIIHHDGQHVAVAIHDKRNPDGDSGSPEQRANAEFIVRAANAHDDLLAACKLQEELIKTIVENMGIVKFIDAVKSMSHFGYVATMQTIREAIAKAE
jgi:hypothetical protein